MQRFSDLVLNSRTSGMNFTGQYTLEETVERGCVATIGFFDGVHCGHRFLLRQVVGKAAELSLPSVVVSFSNHPASVLRPELRPLLLTSSAEKVGLLRSAGADCVALIDFTPVISHMSARDFMQEFLLKTLNVKVLLMGYDHRFGHGGNNNFEDYLRYGEELGIKVVRGEELRGSESKFCSSSIRKSLLSGDVEGASRLLGYNYLMEGTVVGGFRVGRRIGYPTANVRVGDTDKLIPARGVYAVRLSFPDSSSPVCYGGMMNIGYRPTLNNGNEQSIEVHLFDFSSDIYSECVRIEFVARIRDERCFDTLEQLQEQLSADEKACRSIVDCL